jgi:beta-mannanase
MTEAEDVGLDRLVDACVKIRDRKAVISDEMNTKLSALDDKLTKFKQRALRIYWCRVSTNCDGYFLPLS